MIIDAQLQYSAAQAVTATAASTNSIDHGPLKNNLGRNLGVGEELYLVITLVTAMTDAGSDSTVTVTLETDDNSAFSSATVTRTLGVFAALAAAGTRIVYKLAPGDINEQYSQLRYTVANGNLSTGAFTAQIVKNPDGLYQSYKDNITIS